MPFRDSLWAGFCLDRSFCQADAFLQVRLNPDSVVESRCIYMHETLCITHFSSRSSFSVNVEFRRLVSAYRLIGYSKK